MINVSKLPLMFLDSTLRIPSFDARCCMLTALKASMNTKSSEIYQKSDVLMSDCNTFDSCGCVKISRLLQRETRDKPLWSMRCFMDCVRQLDHRIFRFTKGIIGIQCATRLAWLTAQWPAVAPLYTSKHYYNPSAIKCAASWQRGGIPPGGRS